MTNPSAKLTNGNFHGAKQIYLALTFVRITIVQMRKTHIRFWSEQIKTYYPYWKSYSRRLPRVNVAFNLNHLRLTPSSYFFNFRQQQIEQVNYTYTFQSVLFQLQMKKYIWDLKKHTSTVTSSYVPRKIKNSNLPSSSSLNQFSFWVLWKQRISNGYRKMSNLFNDNVVEGF